MPRPKPQPARHPADPSKPFDDLSKDERAAWRGLSATRAFRAHLGAIKREVVEALVAGAEKNEGAPALAGMIRGFERVERELLADPAEVRPYAEEEPFVDPAMPPSMRGVV